MIETSLYHSRLKEKEFHPDVTFYYFKQWQNYKMSEAHAHEAVEIMYVLSGRAQVEIASQCLTLKEGDFILIDSYIPHRLLAKFAAPCRMLNVEFTWKGKVANIPSVKGLASENHYLYDFLECAVPFHLFQDNNDIATTLKRLVLELDKREDNELMVQLMFSQLLIQIATIKKNNSFLLTQSPEQNVYIKNAVEFLHHHYDQVIQVDDIAEAVHLNSSYLQRIFKAEMACTLMQYLTEIRIQKAKMLLRHSGIPITGISEYIGINSRQHFSYLFKKMTGQSPSEYRGHIEMADKE